MSSRLITLALLGLITGTFGSEYLASAKTQSKPPIRKLPTRTNSIGMKLVRLPGGTFLMGAKDIPDARPVHRVKLSPFWIGQFEVTNQHYELFKKRKRTQESLGNQQPAIDLSWSDAAAFCQWLSKKEKRLYRLPTEAEWEYAARGGLVQKAFPWGNEDPHGRATVDQTTTTPVGTHAPNNFGLYDTAGNAAELVSDWYGEDYYARSPKVNPKGPSRSYWVMKPAPKGQWRILRGGDHWTHEVDNAQRQPWPLGEKPYGIGLRVVMEIGQGDLLKRP